MPKLVVVDEPPSNMKLAALLLGNAGYRVLRAADAEAGLHGHRRDFGRFTCTMMAASVTFNLRRDALRGSKRACKQVMAHVNGT